MEMIYIYRGKAGLSLDTVAPEDVYSTEHTVPMRENEIRTPTWRDDSFENTLFAPFFICVGTINLNVPHTARYVPILPK